MPSTTTRQANENASQPALQLELARGQSFLRMASLLAGLPLPQPSPQPSPSSLARSASRAQNGRPSQAAFVELDDLVPVSVRVVELDVWLQTAVRRSWTVRLIYLAHLVARLTAEDVLAAF